jgi:arginyl-tRNA synthetase
VTTSSPGTGYWPRRATLRFTSSTRTRGRSRSSEASAERALALKLLRFGEALKTATNSYAPHKLCTYLYETAVAFSRFFEGCPILKASSPSLRASRLRLTTLTSQTLALGLSLLGIEAPDQL